MVFAIIVFAANLYLQTDAVQERIQRAASQAAGVPVQIQGTSYTPWSGVKVTGIVVPQEGDSQVPFLDVASVSVRFRLLALLRGQFLVREVLVKNPVLSVVQRADGRWARPPAFPAVAEEVTVKPGGPVVIEAPDAVGTPSVPTTPAPAVPIVAVPVLPLERLRIRDGEAHFEDASRRRAGFLEGIELDVLPANDGSATGSFRISRAELFGRLFPYDIRGTFTYRAGQLEIPDFEAVWAEGVLTGRLLISTGAEPRFSASLRAVDVVLAKLAQDSGFRGEGTRGKMFGSCEITGVPGRPDSFIGAGHVELRSARFEPAEFIRQIGEIMAISELQMLQLKVARADFTIADQKVQADAIVLESENLFLEARGPAEFNGDLNLEAKLHLNDKLRRDLRALLGKNLRDSERDGYMHVPFSVTGTVSRPESDLLEKISGVRIGRDVGGLLKNLLRIPIDRGSASPQKAEPEQ